MVLSEARRRALYDAWAATWGKDVADHMTEVLPPFGWGDVARQSDLTALRGEMGQLRGELKGEMAGLKGEMAELRAELKGDMTGLRREMADLRAELKGDMTGLRGEIAELRGHIQRLDGRIDAQFGRIMSANVVMAFGVAGLVLAANRIG